MARQNLCILTSAKHSSQRRPNYQPLKKQVINYWPLKKKNLHLQGLTKEVLFPSDWLLSLGLHPQCPGSCYQVGGTTLLQADLLLNLWNQVQVCSASKSELTTGWMPVTPTAYCTNIFIQSSRGEEGEQKVQEHASVREQELLYQLSSDKNTPKHVQKRAKLM